MGMFDIGQEFVSGDDYFLRMIVDGGNHGFFGHYNYTLRTSILGQNDGVATITRQNQVDLTIAAIVYVASRVRAKLPALVPKIVCEEENVVTLEMVVRVELMVCPLALSHLA